MTDDNRLNHGVPLVATAKAGSTGAPGPLPRGGPLPITGGHPRWRFIRRRRRGLEVTSDTPHNTQHKQPEQHNILNILQINISGIKEKKVTLAHLLDQKNVHVALIQETQHKSEKTDPYISNYTAYPCDCTECQGIITYIRNDQQATVEKIISARPTCIQKVNLWNDGNKFTIYNVYNPPKNHCSFNYLTDSVYHKTVLAGDFNGSSPQWGYTRQNNSGRAIEELCESTNLTVLQDEHSTPTLFHRAHKTLHRPDLTILSSDLLHQHTVEVIEDIGSDHRPIFTTVFPAQKTQHQTKTRWNWKKGQWKQYAELTEQQLGGLTENKSADNLCQQVVSEIEKAAEIYIPRGCRKKFKPFWNQDIEQAANRREAAKKSLEENPNSTEHKVQYNKACAQVKRTVLVAKRSKWGATTAELDLAQDGKKAWTLLSNLSGEKRTTNQKPMTTEDGTITDDKKKAEAHNKYFASINKSSKLSDKDKEKLQKLKAQEKAPSVSRQIFEEDFTMTELNKTFKKLKKCRSPGPDRIHNEMLIHLGPIGRQTILRLVNLTLQTSEIPRMWRNAILNPILKKGKPPDDLGSYRPISLTSSLGKIAERMINTRLYWYLEKSGILNKNQAGFRAGFRTEDQLFRMSQRILDGFQRKEHTTAVFVDLQQAYDRVWRKGLLLKMRDAGVHGKLYNWIKYFLVDRTIQTKINDAISSKHVLEEGLPQGSPLSCTLFLLFINDIKDILKTENALYADDLALWNTNKYPMVSARRLNEDLQRLEKYCEEWKLKVNIPKTVYTIFTKSHKLAKSKVNITFQGNLIEKDPNPVYLGVTLDSQLSLKEHTNKVKNKATKRLNLLKRLASTSWGADKNTLRQLYLGYVRSTMDYNLMLQSTCSKATQNSLNKVQNHALRFISGAMRSTPTSACEIHTNVEPLKFRREAAVIEGVERYKRLEKDHPNRKLVENTRPNLRLKKKSILDLAEDLQGKHRLSENRECEPLFDQDLPPHKELQKPQINVNLDTCFNKKDSDPAELLIAAQRTIDKYPEDCIHVYTDGSAFKGTKNAGYGSRMQHPDKTCEEIFDSCGADRSNYEAEAKAIDASLCNISKHFTEGTKAKKDIVVFSDAKSVLQALDSGKFNNVTIRELTKTIDCFITEHAIKLTLQWIPGHVNVQGNERADTLAKQGASCPQPDVPTSIETAKQTIRANKKEEWMNEWATGETGRVMFQHMTTPKPKDSINELKRNESVTIFRLRTQHVPLNSHLRRIGVTEDSSCPLCPCPDETVEHHLFECPALADLRAQHLPPNPTIENTLYTHSEQLGKTHTYFVMSSSRRARAQPLLDRNE